MVGKTFKNREVGITSRGHEDGLIFLIKSIRSCELIGSNEPSISWDGEGLELGSEIPGLILDLINATLSTKKIRNLLQSLFERHGNVVSGGETMLLIVSNRILGFFFEEVINLAK